MANRYKVVANVHEGGVWLAHVKQLEAIIQRAYQLVDSEASVTIMWMRLPKGSMYLAGKPSTTSTIVTPMPDNINQQERERFMHTLCEAWMAVTGCDINEIIVNAMNQKMMSAYMALNQSRFQASSFKLKMTALLSRVLLKRFSRGYTSLTINLKP